jgi:MerR family transcriptional regulator, light-induced transcriptional regulator
VEPETDGASTLERRACGPSGGAALGVTAAARRLGVTANTLRSWHRRYGIGPSGHVEGRARRYQPADLVRLRAMHNSLIRGRSAADAARDALALEIDLAVAHGHAGRPDDAPAGTGSTRTDSSQPPGSRQGGRNLALPGAGPRARGLARAVLGMDAAAVRTVLADALAVDGVIGTWESMARPVLAAIGERWATTASGVEHEHLLSECLIRVLDGAFTVATPRNPRPVLLASAPDEWHSLPLSVLAAALAERSVDCHLLGAALPTSALHASLRRLAPGAAVIWAQASTPALAGIFDEMPRTRPACRWYAAGPGWDGHGRPAAVGRLTSLRQATEELVRCVVPSITPPGGVAPAPATTE